MKDLFITFCKHLKKFFREKLANICRNEVQKVWIQYEDYKKNWKARCDIVITVDEIIPLNDKINTNIHPFLQG